MSQTLATSWDARANVPRIALNATVDLNGFYVSPVGGRVFHVRGDGTSILAYDDQYGANSIDMNRRLWPSVASVLPLCVANRGDRIIVHQNHTENIATADAWAFVAGMSIVGLGWGATRPKFTFTASNSTLVLDAAGVSIENCQWHCAGPTGTTALTVAAPFTISGEGNVLKSNYFQIGIDADQKCAAFAGVSGDNCIFYNNEISSLAVAAAPTSAIILTGADNFIFESNFCKSAFGNVATGWIANTTTASTNIRIVNNFLHNWLANSTHVINLAANSVTTGFIGGNTCRIEKVDSVAPIGTGGTGVDVTLGDGSMANYCINEANKRGIIIGTASDA